MEASEVLKCSSESKMKHLEKIKVFLYFTSEILNAFFLYFTFLNMHYYINILRYFINFNTLGKSSNQSPRTLKILAKVSKLLN